MYLFILCVCVCTCVRGSEDNLREPVLSFVHMSQTQVVRLGNRHLYYLCCYQPVLISLKSIHSAGWFFLILLVLWCFSPCLSRTPGGMILINPRCKFLVDISNSLFLPYNMPFSDMSSRLNPGEPEDVTLDLRIPRGPGNKVVPTLQELWDLFSGGVFQQGWKKAAWVCDLVSLPQTSVSKNSKITPFQSTLLVYQKSYIMYYPKFLIMGHVCWPQLRLPDKVQLSAQFKCSQIPF